MSVSTEGSIVGAPAFVEDEADAVMILWSLVYSDGRLSDIVKDRADTAMEVYLSGKAQKILVSGDNGRKEYDEVRAIREYLLSEGIPAHDIFLDFAWFDTYDSMYRAQYIFDVQSLVIATQGFHLPRAVYTAQKLGIETVWVVADRHIYVRRTWFDMRESLARVKARGETTFGSRPKYLGAKVPIYGKSNVDM